MTSTIEVGPAPEDVKGPADDDDRLWSVTTLLKALSNPAFEYSAVTKTSTAAVRSERAWKAILDSAGEDEAIRWLEGARFRTPKGERAPMELGTAVHEACEGYVITGERPEVDAEVAPFLAQFDAWCDEFQPAYEAAEMTVFSPTYGYAGTCDAFLTVGGVRTIVDYKTTKRTVDKKGNPTGPYPEVALQLAAYRWAEMAAVWRPRRFEKWKRRYYLLSPAEREMAVPVPEVDTGLVIHITPEHCRAFPVRCDEEVHESFLAVIDAARWQFELSKDVIGQPLVTGGGA